MLITRLYNFVIGTSCVDDSSYDLFPVLRKHQRLDGAYETLLQILDRKPGQVLEYVVEKPYVTTLTEGNTIYGGGQIFCQCSVGSFAFLEGPLSFSVIRYVPSCCLHFCDPILNIANSD